MADLLSERGIDICHETARFWWNRFGPMLAAEIRCRRVRRRSYSRCRWHLDEVFVRINGETHYLWRAVDREGEVLLVRFSVGSGPDRRCRCRTDLDPKQTQIGSTARGVWRRSPPARVKMADDDWSVWPLVGTGPAIKLRHES